MSRSASPSCSWRAAERVELGLGVGPHLGVGLAGAELLGLGDLAAQFEIPAVGDRHLRQRAPFLRQGRARRASDDISGSSSDPLDLKESLIIGLELLEHGRASDRFPVKGVRVDPMYE